MTARKGAIAAGAVVGAVLIALSLAGLASYTGSTMVFALFCICYLALAILMVPRPRPYVFVFFAAFLLLGFWMKAIAHFVWSTEFVEPIGDFKPDPASWDTGLALATAGAAGVVAARLLHLWLYRLRPDTESSNEVERAPAWFLARRGQVWTLSIALIVVVNAFNFYLSFYQVGVNPKLILPLHLNVPIGWLVNIGFALWVAALVGWDLNAGKGFIGGFLAAMLEALASSLSAHSRLLFLLHAGPYLLASAEGWRRLRISLGKRGALALFVCFMLLLAVSLAAISRVRFQEYFEMPKMPPEAEAGYIRAVVERQLGRLLIHRWVGLESVLVVSSVRGRSEALFWALLTDSPRRGGDALFQKAAKVPYATHDPRFTFLTNAGPIALLGFSDSLLAAFAGMALLVLVLLATERAARRFTENPFFVAVAGAALANVANQMTFPYLSLIFLLQLLTAIAFIGWVQRWRWT